MAMSNLVASGQVVNSIYAVANGDLDLDARDSTRKVRFFGGNLKATSDFAKKAAKVASEKFLRCRRFLKTNPHAPGR